MADDPEADADCERIPEQPLASRPLRLRAMIAHSVIGGYEPEGAESDSGRVAA